MESSVEGGHVLMRGWTLGLTPDSIVHMLFNSDTVFHFSKMHGLYL